MPISNNTLVSPDATPREPRIIERLEDANQALLEKTERLNAILDRVRGSGAIPMHSPNNVGAALPMTLAREADAIASRVDDFETIIKQLEELL